MWYDIVLDLMLPILIAHCSIYRLKAEDHIETLQKQVENYGKLRQELEEEAKRLILENEQVKEMCRRINDEDTRNQAIITNYKQV